MTVPANSLTIAADSFKTAFAGFQDTFFSYGQDIFFILLTISIVLKGIEYAWTKDLTESMPDWLRELFGAMFFYTIMQNLKWLITLPASANFIGASIGLVIDPSSIVLKGVTISNKIMQPLQKAGFLDSGLAMLIGIICCVAIMFCMISIAMNVAVTLICTQGLISISPLFLCAGAFKPSAPIARNLIDAIIGNSIKLIGFYLTIYAGNKAMDIMANSIDGTFSPTTSSFDQYCYIIAVVTLFYAVAKTFPEQLARLVSGVIQENRGISAMAAATAAVSAVAKTQTMTSTALKAAQIAGGVLAPIGRAAGAVVANTMAHYRQISSSQSSASAVSKTARAMGNALTTTAKETGNAVSDRFRDITNRATGGSSQSIKSVAERIYQNTQRTNAKTQADKFKQNAGDSQK